MAQAREKMYFGLLMMIVLVSGIFYIQFKEQARMRIDMDKTTFYVKNDNNRWVVSGREYNLLFEGTKSVYRDRKSITLSNYSAGKKLFIQRYTKFKNGCAIIDTYKYSSDSRSIELFPIDHKVLITGCKDKFYRYEVRDLQYEGDKYKLSGETSLSFGRQMKVEFEPDYRWARVYKNGVLKIQYDIPSDYEELIARMYLLTKQTIMSLVGLVM